MLYLIGGPPRCGKTTLAEALSRRIGSPYLTLDHVASVITPYIPDSEQPTRLPLAQARRETAFSNDRFYARYSAAEAVDLYLASAKTLWPGIGNFIRYALDDAHHLIVEGWQLLPRPLREALVPDDVDKVRVVYLYKLDVERISAGLKIPTARIDWVTRHTRDEATFLAIADMVSHFSQRMIADARDCSFPTVNTDLDFEGAIDDTLASLLT